MTSFRIILTGVSLAVAAMLLGGCGGNWDVESVDDLGHEFKEEFGVTPPNDVKEMKCRVVNVADTSSRWSSFKCPQNTMNSLVKDGYIIVQRKELDSARITVNRPFDPYERNVNAPKWWPEVARIHFSSLYYRKCRDANFSGYLFVFFDPDAGVVYARSETWR